jgi:hypothetical protein
MLIAVVWHWWIAPLLVALAILLVLATLIGYLKQVTATRYPPRR